MKSPAEAFVWICGELVPMSRAGLSPLDQSFNVGDGLFETLRVHKGKPFSPMRHWNRLVTSCKKIYVQSPGYNAFLSMIELTLQANRLSGADARVRVTVSSGSGGFGAPRGSVDPVVVCTAAPLETSRYEGPARVAVVPWRRNEHGALTGLKSTSYGENVLALQHARSEGAEEAIFANTKGHLCEGATTNVFLVHHGVLHTPPLDSGCLPGVTRDLVLQLCRQHQLPVQETNLPVEALRSADEAFLTSSIRGVQPVSHVDGHPLSRCPGPQGLRLAELYRKLTPAHAAPTCAAIS